MRQNRLYMLLLELVVPSSQNEDDHQCFVLTEYFDRSATTMTFLVLAVYFDIVPVLCFD